MVTMEFTKERAAGYLAAMIDGEGCVECKEYFYPSRKGAPTIRRRIRVTNTSQGIIDATTKCCDILGISYSVHGRTGTNKAAMVVNINAKSFKDLAAAIELAEPGKQARMLAGAQYVTPARSRNTQGQYL